MFEVELTCGEAPCVVTITLVDELAEVEHLLCDECGNCLHLLSVSEAELVELPERQSLALAA